MLQDFLTRFLMGFEPILPKSQLDTLPLSYKNQTLLQKIIKNSIKKKINDSR